MSTFDPVSNLIVILIAVPLYLYLQNKWEKEREKLTDQAKEKEAAHRAELAALNKQHADDLKSIIARYDARAEKDTESDESYRELLGEMVQSIRELTKAYDISERFTKLEQRLAEQRSDPSG